MSIVRNSLPGILAALTMFPTASEALARERWVDIVNEIERPILAVHVSPLGRPDFGDDDLLGPHLIPVGGEHRVTPRAHGDHCRFDVLITYMDGGDDVVWDVNLCRATEIVIDGFGYSHIAY